MLEGGLASRGAPYPAAMMQRSRPFVLEAVLGLWLPCLLCALQCNALLRCPFPLLCAFGSRGLAVGWKLVRFPAERPRRTR